MRRIQRNCLFSNALIDTQVAHNGDIVMLKHPLPRVSIMVLAFAVIWLLIACTAKPVVSWDSFGPPTPHYSFFLFRTDALEVTRYAFWLATSAAFFSALLAFLNIRRYYVENYRFKNGLCQACGYDLRATENRCPECGTTFSVSAKDKTVSDRQSSAQQTTCNRLRMIRQIPNPPQS